MRPSRLLPVVGFLVSGYVGTVSAENGSVPPAFQECVSSAQQFDELLRGDVRGLVNGGVELPDPLDAQVREYRSSLGECSGIKSDEAMREDFLHLYQATSRFTEALRFASLTGNAEAQAMAKQALDGVLQRTGEMAALASK